eukprot:750370-Hanusia_phi.AAC.6
MQVAQEVWVCDKGITKWTKVGMLSTSLPLLAFRSPAPRPAPPRRPPHAQLPSSRHLFAWYLNLFQGIREYKELLREQMMEAQK